jgi:hypothetical protein
MSGRSVIVVEMVNRAPVPTKNEALEYVAAQEAFVSANAP